MSKTIFNIIKISDGFDTFGDKLNSESKIIQALCDVPIST
jgi:hypothetical protein